MQADYDYTAFGEVFGQTRIEDIRDNGVYRLGTPDRPLDVLVEGLNARKNADDPILVFFTGAIAREKMRGPFFYGRGVSSALKLPLVAFSDPSLERDPDLRLAWYAGHAGYTDLPRRIAEFLDAFSRQYGQLILVGGSGGGFAILNVMQHMTSAARAVIWNPQTRIAHYYPSHIRDYASVASGEPQPALSTVAAQEAFDRAGISSDVTCNAALPGQVLYCQNASDAHVSRHCEPFMAQGVWAEVAAGVSACAERGVTVCKGNWGEGHAPLPREAVFHVVRRMCEGADMADIAREIAAMYPLDGPADRPEARLAQQQT